MELNSSGKRARERCAVVEKGGNKERHKATRTKNRCENLVIVL